MLRGVPYSDLVIVSTIFGLGLPAVYFSALIIRKIKSYSPRINGFFFVATAVAMNREQPTLSVYGLIFFLGWQLRQRGRRSRPRGESGHEVRVVCSRVMRAANKFEPNKHLRPNDPDCHCLFVWSVACCILNEGAITRGPQQ
jgi:hypothetical protein